MDVIDVAFDELRKRLVKVFTVSALDSVAVVSWASEPAFDGAPLCKSRKHQV